jgi:hypothetical protein
MKYKINYPIFTSRHSVGLTFVSWSYHCLSGHSHSWNARRGLIPLPENPNTSVNAHNFNKNYRGGFNEWKKFIQDEKNNLENCSMYGGPLRVANTVDTNQDYAMCLEFASKLAPLVVVVESAHDPWYFLHKRAIDPDAASTVVNDTVELYQSLDLTDFLKTYFNESLTKFDKNIWDLRELIALNFEYFKVDQSYHKFLNRSNNYLYVDSKDLWYNGEACLNRIFKYIDKKIVPEQLPHWRNIYREWQSVQIKILQFNWYLPTIVDAIVNNYNFDLDFLNLTLLQEAVIQGHLIKHHNLNLKCYGLEKFPNNTKDLHLLLEESTHL